MFRMRGQRNRDRVQLSGHREKVTTDKDSVVKLTRGQNRNASSPRGQSASVSMEGSDPGAGLQISLATGHGGQIHGAAEVGGLPGPGFSGRGTATSRAAGDVSMDDWNGGKELLGRPDIFLGVDGNNGTHGGDRWLWRGVGEGSGPPTAVAD